MAPIREDLTRVLLRNKQTFGELVFYSKKKQVTNPTFDAVFTTFRLA